MDKRERELKLAEMQAKLEELRDKAGEEAKELVDELEARVEELKADIAEEVAEIKEVGLVAWVKANKKKAVLALMVVLILGSLAANMLGVA